MLRIACVLISCAALLACGEEDEPAPRAGATATAAATQAPGSDEVRDVAQRYLRAHWAADLDGMCETSRSAQGGICDIAEKGRAKPLKGDPPEVSEVRVEGDIAFAEAPGGISLTLLEEKGKWLVDDARGMPELVIKI